MASSWLTLAVAVHAAERIPGGHGKSVGERCHLKWLAKCPPECHQAVQLQWDQYGPEWIEQQYIEANKMSAAFIWKCTYTYRMRASVVLHGAMPLLVYTHLCMYSVYHSFTCVPFFMRIWKPLLYRNPAGMESSCNELQANKNIFVGPARSQAMVTTMVWMIILLLEPACRWVHWDMAYLV